VTPFAHHRGNWSLKDGRMIVESDTDCASFTGHYYSKDAVIRTTFIPTKGQHHALVFRAQGTQRYYQVGFDGEGKVSLHTQNFGLHCLKTVEYGWKLGQRYVFEVVVRGDEIVFSINGENILNYTDSTWSHGMLGIALSQPGSCIIEKVEVGES